MGIWPVDPSHLCSITYMDLKACKLVGTDPGHPQVHLCSLLQIRWVIALTKPELVPQLWGGINELNMMGPECRCLKWFEWWWFVARSGNANVVTKDMSMAKLHIHHDATWLCSLEWIPALVKLLNLVIGKLEPWGCSLDTLMSSKPSVVCNRV
jgi:hypothetical protein